MKEFSNEPLVSKIFEELQLSDEKMEMLLNPQDEVLQGDAVMAVVHFFKHAKKVMICGDYDCDGISATSVAVLLCKALGLEYGYYIPNRIKEGYGTSVETVQMAADRGYTDLLLVDNGVKAYAAIKRAHELDMKVCVVDHHVIEQDLETDAFLHPDLCESYFATMCATGLMACVAETMQLLSDKMIALACVATIADVMPLWGKNREWVRRGLDLLQTQKILQFDALIKRTRYTLYSSTLIAFQIVPKINSIGRLSDQANVNTAVQYFVSDDAKLILSYSQQMLLLNTIRKQKSNDHKMLALKMIDDNPVQIIVHKNFHEGLLGIVANQIAQITEKPTIVLTEYDHVLKGSARSMSISLQALFEQMDPSYFEAMGGHDFAYGMTLKKEYFAAFTKAVNQHAQHLEPVVKTEKRLQIEPQWITKNALNILRSFEPYGEGFKLPRLHVDLPKSYRVVNLNGHGFKLLFADFPIQEAVFFTQKYDKQSLESVQQIAGNFDLSSISKVTFFIDEVF